jgi:transcriptional regulator with XRE-family HTH domain
VRNVQPERLLARYVQGERKRRGWSQRDLAKRLGEVGMDIHATGITRLERGERAIRFDEFFALCQAFDKTAVEVFEALTTISGVAAVSATITAVATVTAEAEVTPAGQAGSTGDPRTVEEVAEKVRLIVSTAHDMVEAVLSGPTPTVSGREEEEADDGVDQ